MRWNFHQYTVEGNSNSSELMVAWQQSFRSRPLTDTKPNIHITLDLVDTVPDPPTGEANFSQGDLLRYYVAGDAVTVHFPRFGQLYLDLSAGTTHGQLVQTALTTYGVLEDLVAISLSPHLRRRGYFLIHAFAAAFNGRAVLLVGGIGAGKTTTGMSLLNAGWQLLSNDSPIVAAEGQILSYPGVLAGYPETFGRFPRTTHLAHNVPTQSGRQKLLISAEDVFPNVWLNQAPIAAICFPQIEQRNDHALTPIGGASALRQLLPHAVEQWDRTLIPAHLRILRQLIESAPAYTLHLGPDVLTIPETLKTIL
ncbi:MAG: hypothetical protein ACPG8W_09440 [Candidatus Promineifilaceae bacterium]